MPSNWVSDARYTQRVKVGRVRSVIIVVVGLAIVLVALIAVYVLIPTDDSREDFCAAVSDLDRALLAGDKLVEAIQTFLDAATDEMISRLPDEWQESARDLVSVSEGAVGLSGFQLDPVVDRIDHELEGVSALCESYSG